MVFRVFPFLLFLFFCASCDKLSFTKRIDTNAIDTIVDFSSVDTFPSFKNCNSIVDKTVKSDCFRKTIHLKITKELQQYSFTIKDSISETVFMNLLINSEGKVVLEEIQSSQNCKRQLPELDSLLFLSIQNLPVIYPAIKRGIPITTKYRLPIIIELKE
jgi:hypothetical protein